MTRGIAERKTFFDDIPRGPRNHDLLVLGDGLVVGIEAKADEPFDKTLAEWVHSENPASQKQQRVEQLAQAFFGGYDTALETLRYQLFSALGGTLADAKEFKASAAVLVVHDFDTPKTKPTKHALNAADLEAFVERLGPAPRRNVKDGWLSGPFTIPGNAHLPGDVPVYVKSSGPSSCDLSAYEPCRTRLDDQGGQIDRVSLYVASYGEPADRAVRPCAGERGPRHPVPPQVPALRGAAD